MSEQVLGYLPCSVCQSPKQIIQGQGKRARFLRARCQCGPDMRTGAAIQAQWAQYQSLEAVEAILNPSLPDLQSDSESDLENQPEKNHPAPQGGGNVARLAVGGICFVLGTVTAKLLRA